MAKENIYAGWDEKTVSKFKSWQFRTILVSMIGYAIYYFVRKNFSIAMPGLTAQYGISNTSFGIVIGISVLASCAGIIKAMRTNAGEILS